MQYVERDGAWVHATAELAEGVALEPGAVVGPEVRVGRGTRLMSHSVLVRRTRLGEENVVHPQAVIGGDPQDTGYRGEPTDLEIGDRNILREGVTIHRGSTKGEGITRVGNDNYLMSGAHVGHDAWIEDRCVFANDVLIAGHCHVQSQTNIAGGAAVVQFCTIGRLAFIGGLAGSRHDLEPFLIHDRSGKDPRVRTVGVNRVGLRRAGFADETIEKLRTAYKVLFQRGEPESFEAARREIHHRGADCPEVEELLAFVERKRRGQYGRQLQV